MKFFDIYGKAHEKPEGADYTLRLSVYGVTYLNRETLVFTRGAHSGMLELPGGQLELGESLSECLRREGLEECGYAISPYASEPFHVQGPNPFCFPEEGKYYWSTGLVFEAYSIGWQMPNFEIDSEEVLEILLIKTFRLQLQDVHPLFRGAVQKSLEKGNSSRRR